MLHRLESKLASGETCVSEGTVTVPGGSCLMCAQTSPNPKCRFILGLSLWSEMGVFSALSSALGAAGQA